MKPRFTLRLYLNDMGSFTQPGCADLEDALWHVNNARDHDGLPPLQIEYLRALSRTRKGSTQWLTTTPESPRRVAETR